MEKCSGHKNIVELFEAVDAGEYFLLRMEKCQDSLLNLLYYGKQSPFSTKEIMTIGLNICRGLEKIHEQAYIHKDIKPSNILFTEKREIKLADFGIAREEERSTNNMHTPGYMQEGERASFKSDIYALGCTLYELWTR